MDGSPPQGIHMVTGAFGYSGRYIAERLLQLGCPVRTLTNSPRRSSPLSGRIEACPWSFDDPVRLTQSLRGVSVLYNTYWVRFNGPSFSFAEAVANTKVLFHAAREAGVRRIVHVSITNPAENSAWEYFRGKAELERALAALGVSYTILRPAVLFGREDVLINNIAWVLRRFPLFAVFGDGNYRLQPIYVDDLAQLAVTAGAAGDNTLLQAIGPETFTYRELVATIGRSIGRARPIVSVPPALAYLAARLIGKLVGDVLVTRDEIQGLMAGLLSVDAPPAGTTRLSDWAAGHADTLGRRYANELLRRRDRRRAYLDH
jgi:NADH dehydrogenase